MKRRVKFVALINSIQAPPHIVGELTLGVKDKQPGIEMWTGIEPGFVTIFYKGGEIGVPMANVRDVIWEKAAIDSRESVARLEQAPGKSDSLAPQPSASEPHKPGNTKSSSQDPNPPELESCVSSALR